MIFFLLGSCRRLGGMPMGSPLHPSSRHPAVPLAIPRATPAAALAPLLALWAGVSFAADLVTVTLVGGGKVTATLLRQSDEGLVLDLGYEVLQIPPSGCST